jgi:hypothetical protein
MADWQVFRCNSFAPNHCLQHPIFPRRLPGLQVLLMHNGNYDLEGVQRRNQCRSCGKAFAQSNALSNHLRSCKEAQNRLHNALAGARRVWSEGRGAAKRLKLAHTSGGPGTTPMSGTTKEAIPTEDAQGSEDVIVSSIISQHSSS